MRFVLAATGLLASVVGSHWLLFGVGLIATRNIICFDVCNDREYGPNQLWMLLGAGLFFGGVVAAMWALGRKGH